MTPLVGHGAPENFPHTPLKTVRGRGDRLLGEGRATTPPGPGPDRYSTPRRAQKAWIAPGSCVQMGPRTPRPQSRRPSRWTSASMKDSWR